jgi:hypothetical protein
MTRAEGNHWAAIFFIEILDEIPGNIAMSDHGVLAIAHM